MFIDMCFCSEMCVGRMYELGGMLVSFFANFKRKKHHRKSKQFF